MTSQAQQTVLGRGQLIVHIALFDALQRCYLFAAEIAHELLMSVP